MSTKTKIVITEEDLKEAKKTLHQLKVKQEKLREQELEIRVYLADALHEEEGGSKTIKLGDTKITISRPITYSIDEVNAEKFSKEHGDVALDVLKWKPQVVVGAFKKNLDVASEYIVAKPGPPTVEIK